MKEAEYIKRVDELLENENAERRAELLHQNTPYSNVLAFNGDWMQSEMRCERVARTLMFHLGEAYFYEKLPRLQDCFEFLYGALLYLELICCEEDRTYNGLMKLSRLDQETRELLQPLDGHYADRERYLKTFRSIKTPFDPDKLEVILLYMTDWSWEDLAS